MRSAHSSDDLRATSRVEESADPSSSSLSPRQNSNPTSQADIDIESISSTVHISLKREGLALDELHVTQHSVLQKSSNRLQYGNLDQIKWYLVLVCVTTALFAVTVWFAQATFSVSSLDNINSHLRSLLHIDVSSTLAILRLLEGLLSLCANLVLTKTFETLQWTLSNRPKGLSLLSLLGLSPTSGYFGTLALTFGKYSSFSNRLAAGSRIGLSSAIWISGVVLFTRTRLELMYEPVMSYNVTAGVGQFNGSFIPEYLQRFQDNNAGYEYAVLPYSTVITASNLIVNPMHSTAIDPVSCEVERKCHGYLMSGGLAMTTPWPPEDYKSHPVITIKNTPSTQIDFVRGIHNDSFDDLQDCSTFGGEGFLIGIKFCLARSVSAPGSLFAGVFVCTQGEHSNECWTDSHPPEVTTTFSVYHRYASINTARSNFSIISVDKMAEPVQNLELDVGALKEAFAWLFNFTAADIPGPSSIAQYFWTVQDQLESESFSVEPYQIFQSILAFPFWQFNPNNFGNVQLDAQNITVGLPSEFYTTASIGSPLNKIIINRPMFILFCFLQAMVLCPAWAVLIWTCFWAETLVNISSYPLVDFATKTNFTGTALNSLQGGTDGNQDSVLATAFSDSFIRKVLRDRRVGIRKLDPDAAGSDCVAYKTQSSSSVTLVDK